MNYYNYHDVASYNNPWNKNSYPIFRGDKQLILITELGVGFKFESTLPPEPENIPLHDFPQGTFFIEYLI